MNCKTRNEAIRRLNEYGPNGVVFQYKKSGRWNWATNGSGLWADCLNTLSETGEAILNPHGRSMYRVGVQNVKFFGATI